MKKFQILSIFNFEVDSLDELMIPDVVLRAKLESAAHRIDFKVINFNLMIWIQYDWELRFHPLRETQGLRC